ncbi:MAG: NERD domain-containing protein [Clostridia bacterium]|nr:NERD domain-containing protein [Clostridia bacterium]
MDIGESLVGSYFKYVLGCKIVVYNCHIDKEGEIDVIALSPDGRTVYLCEVATHLRGLLYGNNNAATLARVTQKIKRAAAFAAAQFPDRKAVFMLWAPCVSRYLSRSLAEIQQNMNSSTISVQLVLNRDYTARISSLRDVARENIKTTDEPAFRLLQVLEHLR